MIGAFFGGRTIIKLLTLILLCASVVSAQKSARKLIFADEFNGASGSAIDSTKWTMQTGGNGWETKSCNIIPTAVAMLTWTAKASLSSKRSKRIYRFPTNAGTGNVNIRRRD